MHPNNTLSPSAEVEFRLPRLHPDSRWAFAIASYKDINIGVNNPKGKVGGKPNRMGVSLRSENETGSARLQQISDINHDLKVIGKGDSQYARLDSYL